MSYEVNAFSVYNYTLADRYAQMLTVVIFLKLKFIEKLNSMPLLFLAVAWVPELFRKMRGTCGIHFHLVAFKSELECPS